MTPARSLVLALLVAGCAAAPSPPLDAAAERAVVQASVQALTDVMVHDIFSPPQASRVYAYATVAGYEAARHADAARPTYAGRLNGLTPPPQPEGEIDPVLAGTHAFFRVADALVFSQDRLVLPRDTLLAAFDGLAASVRRASQGYGEAVGDHVLAWSKSDGYARTRSLPRYTPVGADAWEPTPPGYIEAIEPYWGELRPFVLRELAPYAAPPPAPYASAAFSAEVREVLDATTDMTDEQTLIASFWDCNPFVLHEEGHLSYAAKKISPGGHWMGIVGVAVRQHESSPAAAWAAYSQTAVALADAFIVSWADKYRTNVIRPETAIRRQLDASWRPLLQTPPFPEYTSGHSVISTAAAEVLTAIYGEVAFVDNVEVPYGLPERAFDSFRDAASEAAISRLYGGIHYRPAIENGVVQGRAVGEAVVDRLGLATGRLAASHP